MPFCVALRSDHPDSGKPESPEHQEEPEVDIAHAVARALIAGDRPEQVERQATSMMKTPESRNVNSVEM